MRKIQVGIVGGGLAGLIAGDLMNKAGLDFMLFEGSDRIGGRVHSERGFFGTGLVTELGAEFIDSTHLAVLDLCREFSLPLLDTQAESEAQLQTSYFFEGVHRREEDVIAAFAPLAKKMRRDLDRLYTVGGDTDFKVLAWLDSLSISQYLTRIGASGWMRELLEVGYTTENSIEAAEQSCLNLLEMIDLEADTEFNIFGDSDQRYKIAGGNDRLPKAIGARFAGKIVLQHTLIALEDNRSAYTLSFKTDQGVQTVAADFVVLAIPFTALRSVTLPDSWPVLTLEAIRDLGYGSNEKLIVGCDAPVWRDTGFSGDAYSDLAFQSGWDSARMQTAAASSYTFYLGGKAAESLDPAYWAAATRFVELADALYPGLQRGFNGHCLRTEWTRNPFFRGSYSSFKVGQTAKFRESAFLPLGRLFFAGEHCSAEFQGFMNGAIESGIKAANEILSLARK